MRRGSAGLAGLVLDRIDRAVGGGDGGDRPAAPSKRTMRDENVEGEITRVHSNNCSTVSALARPAAPSSG